MKYGAVWKSCHIHMYIPGFETNILTSLWVSCVTQSTTNILRRIQAGAPGWGGVLPIMADTGGLCPKGVPFSGFRSGGVLGSIFAGYVPLASLNPYPIIVYSVANYRPHASGI